MADKPKTLQVRFNASGIPPARLEVDGVVIEAGGVATLPAEIAQALIDNPEMQVSLAPDAPVAINPPGNGDETKES